MRSLRFFIAVLLFALIVPAGFSQRIIINEVMSSNQRFLRDEDGDTPDWIELRNISADTVNLESYSINDDPDVLTAWRFPSFSLAPNQYLLVFASGKDRKSAPSYWQTIIKEGDAWKYIIPNGAVNAGWRSTGFDDSFWSNGTSGIGYGDNDDNTVIPGGTISVFMRKTFTVEDKNQIQDAYLHMDFDDAFVAYINGVEIARANITSAGPPAYNAFADNSSHEARMYTGGEPDEFQIEDISSLLLNGENVLAIQVHNAGENSSDMSAIPFLSLGYNSPVAGTTESFVDIPQTKFHTDFSISASGESLYLFRNYQLEDSLEIDSLPTNISYGRNINSIDELNYYSDPTPEMPNNTAGYTSLTGMVSFSVKGGIYTSGFVLRLDSDNPSDQIYYTTDFTEPTKNSQLYTGLLAITNTTAIRAKIINDGGMPGPVSSESYLFNIDHDIPVISLVTDPDNFFGYEDGIYVQGPGHPSSGENCDNGQNWWQNWERPVHVSMFNETGQQAFSQNAGVKIFGGCSRNFAQKSLSLRFRKMYGKEGLDFKVFDDLDLETFHSLNLRSSGNDWNQTMMKDAFASRFFPEMIERQAYQPSVVYLNGEYWGIHNIRERYDEDYYATYYDLDPSSINIMEFHVNWLINLVEGDDQHYLDMLNFIETHDLTVDENYEWVTRQMDVENFAVYQASNIAVKNTDWPGNNVKSWQSFDYDGKWRWMTYDLDFGFSDTYHNTLTFAMEDSNTGWPNPALSTFLLRKLNTNPDFQHTFINAFADVLNTTWRPDYWEPIFNEMKSTISGEIPAHMSRWGGNASGWSSRTDGMKNFANQRPEVVRNFVKSFYSIDGMYELAIRVNDEAKGNVKVNTVDAGKWGYPWEGQYFNNVPVRMVAVPNKGYRFTNWSGSSRSVKDTIFFTADDISVIQANFEVAPSYEDIVVINEIFYTNIDFPNPEDWVELHNKGDNAVDLSNWLLKDDNDSHQFQIPQGTSIPGKGYLVLCRNELAFKSVYFNEMQTIGNFNFGFSNESDWVRIYNHQEILIDSLAYTNPDPFDPEAFSYQRFENENGEEWIITKNYGTPGAENTLSGVGIANQADFRPAQFSAHPNPFNETLNLRFEIYSETFVSIQITSLDGKYIQQIEDGVFNSGSYELNWRDASQLPKGIYLVTLKTGNEVQIRKVIKL